MTLEAVRRVADAVLWEGYVLYPYRASSAKNEVRFQFGVVMPQAYGATTGEPSHQQTQVLVCGDGPVSVYLRFLQLQARELFDRDLQAVASLPGLVPWEEAVERCLAFPLQEGQYCFDVSGAEVYESVPGGVVVRRRWPVHGLVRMLEEVLDGCRRLTLQVSNVTPFTSGRGRPNEVRSAALRHAMLGLHAILEIEAGAFVSLLEPPPVLEPAAQACRQEHVWPVLVGYRPQRNFMLASPIILYDYPAIAPQSPVSFHDGTEIDEMLTLRVMTLTDREKAEARATDPRAARIVDTADSMTATTLSELHGVMRPLQVLLDGAPPEQDSVDVGGVPVRRGVTVKLHPNRRADVMDMFLEGRDARVEGIFRDLEGLAYLAVSVGGDEGWHGRSYFFYPDEVEVCIERSVS